MFYAFGYNQYNVCNCASHNNKDNVHAEVDCMNKLRRSVKLKKINLIVFRTNNKGDSLLMAKPCDSCMRYIHDILNKKNYKLQCLWYTNEDGNCCKY